MPRMTSAELVAYNARQYQKSVPKNFGSVGCDKESKLHEQIFTECRRRGWIALHGSMSERTYRTKGEPDFVILGNRKVMHNPDGWEPRVYFIECKTRTGKLSMEQAAMLHHAARLGHTIHIVRSFEEFLNVLGTTGSPVMKEGV